MVLEMELLDIMIKVMVILVNEFEYFYAATYLYLETDTSFLAFQYS